MTNSRSADSPTLEGPSGVTDPIKGADLNGAPSSVAARQPDGYVREVRRILGRFGTRRTIRAGESLFDPADTSGHLYIVESGTIDVSLPDDPAHHPLASFHAGAVFLFDFGGYQVASLEAAKESVAIDLPLARMNRLCRQEMELRLLLRQCHAFDLKSFLDVCYPARSRFRLVHRTEEVEKPRAGGNAPRRSPYHPRADRQFMIPLGPESGSHYTGNSRPRKRRARRSRDSAAGDPHQVGET